ncbi:hypothetical protein QBC39DRAFT_78851 [Podospora conica]|nr:hypothetical protein QBC39DRAFT_78851 [Schizothecium conicum]
MTILTTTSFPTPPFLSTLTPSLLAASTIQLLFALPSILLHTDLLYDLAGGWAFFATLTTSLLVPALRRGASITLDDATTTWNWRQLALTGAALVYSTRLSTFLFLRVLQKGHDSRFDETKHKPVRFAVFWLAELVWVLMCSMPVLVVNSLHPAAFKAGMGVPGLLRTDVVGFALFGFGLAVEVVADWQKSVWYGRRVRKEHDERFMTGGLFAWCRYPNYAGDITLWAGIAIVAGGVLAQGPIKAYLGWWGLPGILKAVLLPACAPAFEAWALIRLSGVPISEKKYDGLYGKDKKYQEWRTKTRMLIPGVY